MPIEVSARSEKSIENYPASAAAARELAHNSRLRHNPARHIRSEEEKLFSQVDPFGDIFQNTDIACQRTSGRVSPKTVAPIETNRQPHSSITVYGTLGGLGRDQYTHFAASVGFAGHSGLPYGIYPSNGSAVGVLDSPAVLRSDADTPFQFKFRVPVSPAQALGAEIALKAFVPLTHAHYSIFAAPFVPGPGLVNCTALPAIVGLGAIVGGMVFGK